MSLTQHQEEILTETHAVAITTKAMLEIHVRDISETKVRVDRLEKKLNFFMGVWAAVSTVAAGFFTWIVK